MKDDRRSRRTRRLVTAAMAELLLERPYDEITVQAIIDRADVGRATFYNHFRDKLDVVNAVTAEMFAGDGRAAAPGAVPTAELFRHAAERYRTLRAMVDTPGSEVFWREAQGVFASMIEHQLAPAAGRQRPAVPPAIAAQFVSGAVLAVLKSWLRDGMPYPPEQVASFVESLMPPAVRADARKPD